MGKIKVESRISIYFCMAVVLIIATPLVLLEYLGQLVIKLGNVIRGFALLLNKHITYFLMNILELE